MNGDNNLKLRYTDFLEETKKINQSILNDERKKAEQKGLIKGKIEGKIEGRLENQREMVLNMYDKNLSAELISEYTNISIEDVNNIINSK